MSYASASEIREATAELLRPPRRVSVSDAAEQYLRISTPGGFVGNWSRETFPYMVEPMDVTSSPCDRCRVRWTRSIWQDVQPDRRPRCL